MLSNLKEFLICVALALIVTLIISFVIALLAKLDKPEPPTTTYGHCVIYQYQSINEYECEITADKAVIDFNRGGE